jgi:hypothetical protein
VIRFAASRKVLEFIEDFGGEGGIRTLGTGYPVRQISNLVPSTTRPPLRAIRIKHLRACRGCRNLRGVQKVSKISNSGSRGRRALAAWPALTIREADSYAPSSIRPASAKENERFASSMLRRRGRNRQELKFFFSRRNDPACDRAETVRLRLPEAWGAEPPTLPSLRYATA